MSTDYYLACMECVSRVAGPIQEGHVHESIEHGNEVVAHTAWGGANTGKVVTFKLPDRMLNKDVWLCTSSGSGAITVGELMATRGDGGSNTA